MVRGAEEHVRAQQRGCDTGQPTINANVHSGNTSPHSGLSESQQAVELVVDYQDWGHKEKVHVVPAVILDEACNDGRAGRTIERMGARRYL